MAAHGGRCAGRVALPSDAVVQRPRSPPQLAHLTVERREIGLRPLARTREQRSGSPQEPQVKAKRSLLICSSPNTDKFYCCKT
jgi:hypothetical protein